MENIFLEDFITQFHDHTGIRLQSDERGDMIVCWEQIRRGPHKDWSVKKTLDRRVKPLTGNLNIWVIDSSGKRVHGKTKIMNLS
jgi:hypothetical protein